MTDLAGRVVLVTGASRGVGKGIALALGEAGATVYLTGRTVERGTGPEGLPGTIVETAEEVAARGGRAIAIRCDHRDDAQVEAVFRRISEEQNRLDVLVNNVWGGYEGLMYEGQYVDSLPFWRQPLSRWDSMFSAGVRAHYVCSVFAARQMVEQQRGLIVTISYWAAQRFIGSPAYGAAKAADDTMIRDMAHQLREHKVAAVSLYPGLVRTENVMRFAEAFDMSNSESPEFTGRVVAALAADESVLDRSGQVLVAAAVAREYGVIDVDGRQPVPLT